MDGLIVLMAIYFALQKEHDLFTTLDAIFMLSLITIMGIAYDRMGMYRKFSSPIKSSIKLVTAWSLSFAFTLSIFVLAGYFDRFDSSAMLTIFLVALGGQLVNQWIIFGFHASAASNRGADRKVLLVGGGPLAKHLYENINNNPWMQETIIGCIKIFPDGEDIGIPIIGGPECLLDAVRVNNIVTVYIAVAMENTYLVESIYLDLVNENVDIHWVPNLLPLDLINHSVKEIGGLPLLTLSESPLIGNHRLLKACVDKITAIFLLTTLSPLFLIVALIVKISSPGPIIFRQYRTGWNGKKFQIWKFRSMKMHSEENGWVKQATRNDDRITGIGKFIRKTSIDELPQLINVISGEMSMVGPRPHAIEHNSEYDKRIQVYMARHRIKPGITGLAQINGYRGETDTLDKMKVRVDFDIQYINNWSLWLDLKIILLTIPALLKGEAY